jgi:hypothetical protein
MRGIGYLQDQFSFFVMVIRLNRRFNRRGNLLKTHSEKLNTGASPSSRGRGLPRMFEGTLADRDVFDIQSTLFDNSVAEVDV